MAPHHLPAPITLPVSGLHQEEEEDSSEIENELDDVIASDIQRANDQDDDDDDDNESESDEDAMAVEVGQMVRPLKSNILHKYIDRVRKMNKRSTLARNDSVSCAVRRCGA